MMSFRVSRFCVAVSNIPVRFLFLGRDLAAACEHL